MFAALMQNREQHIISYAAGLFREKGFKQVTMDDLARHMSISKKTLYKHFNNKKDLISRIICLYVEKEKVQFAGYVAQARDAVEEMVRVIRHMLMMFEEEDFSNYEELKIYYPVSWQELDSFLSDHIYKRIHANMQRGLEEGLYREDLDTDILARMYVVKVRGIMEEKIFPRREYEKRTLLKVMVEYHLRGIVNEKGIKRLDHYMNAV